MACGHECEAPDYDDHFSFGKLRRSASLPNIKMLLRRPPASMRDSARTAEESENPAQKEDPDPMVTAALGGRNIISLRSQDLKSELTKRGLSKKGNKAELVTRLKTSILKGVEAESSSRHNPKDNKETNQGRLNIDPEIKEVPGQSDNSDKTMDRCPCYEHVNSSIEKISRQIAELTRKISGNQTSNNTEDHSDVPSPMARLKEENSVLRSQLSSMKEKYERVLEERDSLNLAVKIISKDLYANTYPNQTKAPPQMPDKGVPQEYHENKTPERKETTAKKTGKNANKTAEKKRKKKTDKKPASDRNEANAAARKPVTVICGDSIIQHVRGWSLSQATDSNKVVVKSFPGATCEDMEDYLKPVLRKEPEHIIIHIGTNDLRDAGPKRTAESIVNLGLQVEEDSPNTSVTISALLKRADDEDQATPQANKLLKQYCQQHKWNFIDNDNITREHLNRGGLHLTKEGSTLLARNYIGHIRGD